MDILIAPTIFHMSAIMNSFGTFYEPIKASSSPEVEADAPVEAIEELSTARGEELWKRTEAKVSAAQSGAASQQNITVKKEKASI